MKKIYVFAVACVFFLGMQLNTNGQAAIDKGNVLLNLGLGAGYYYAGGVPFVFSAEFAINDAITIGPYIGFTSYRYRYTSAYRYSYTFIDIGARGAYHFSKHLNLNTDKLDLYGGALLGYVASSYSGDSFGYRDPYGGNVRFGIFGGARWYFTDKFAVNGEVGYGVAALLAGITLKLGR